MNKNNMKDLLNSLGIDYLLVNSTNKFLVEYSCLSENARYKLTGFSGSTGDALITADKIYLFVDGRYHSQADEEAQDGVTVVKLGIGEKQDDLIKQYISKDCTLGIVSKKISQLRLESFNGYKIKLLEEDPINNYTEPHNSDYTKVFKEIEYKTKPIFITNLEEASYLTGLRDFSTEYSSKIWAKLFIDGEKRILFDDDEKSDKFLKEYTGDLIIDKSTISAHDYSLIKNPIHRTSEVKMLKSIKSPEEIEAYEIAFEKTDKAVGLVRDYINSNENLSEYDIAECLKNEFRRNGAKLLSFKPIVAINQNSAMAHYSKSSKDVKLNNGDLVLIDCGAYYTEGLATDITRVFVKGQPNNLQRQVYTTVLKAFLNAFNSKLSTGFELDTLAHTMLDNCIDGFKFGHGLGHGIGINVHEAPPNLSQNEIAKTPIKNGMTFTIEPGLYNPNYFGVRLENSCYRENDKTKSFVKMGYEGKLINIDLLTKQEKQWLEDFEIL